MRDAIDRILAAENQAKKDIEQARDGAASEIKGARVRGREHVQRINETAHKEGAEMMDRARKEAMIREKKNKEDAQREEAAILQQAKGKMEEAVESIVERIVADL